MIENSIAQRLHAATLQLASVTDVAALEASVLLAFILNVPRTYLYAHPEIILNETANQHFDALIRRRLADEPLAYITGKQEFWSLMLTVTKDTLIPRPDTEMLVQTALQLFPDKKISAHVADLGTGSGAIALALASERPLWQLRAIDASQAALDVAKQNAHDLGFTSLSFYCGSWSTVLSGALSAEPFDLIVSNPPYLAESEWQQDQTKLGYEPKAALVAEGAGLGAIAEIATLAYVHLVTEGYLIVEHGYAQGVEVRKIFTEAGYQSVETVKDLVGHERVTMGRR